MNSLKQFLLISFAICLVLLMACESNPSKVESSPLIKDHPIFNKKKLLWEFQKRVNPEGDVPIFGVWDAYNELVADGKMAPYTSVQNSQKTTDSLWRGINDFFSSMAVTGLDYDRNNPNVYYFCTGEGWGNVDGVRGAGIWKSIDAGETWNQIEGTTVDTFALNQKIAVHPITSDVYLATLNFGLLRSQDGGDNWERVLGQGLGSFRNSISDIEFTSDGGIFVGIGIFETDGLYYSNNGDVNTWFDQTNGFPINSIFRVEVATAPSDPDVAYAIPISTGSDNYEIRGVYKTVNKGASWDTVSLPGGDKQLARSQGWYDLIIEVDPNDEDVVVAGGLNLWRTRDGGATWQQLTHGRIDSTEYQYVHVDQHEINFLNSDTVFFGCDGGVYASFNFTDDFPEIQPYNLGYAVTQYYAAAIFPDPDDTEIFGGTQDNGTYISTSAGVSDFELLTWQDGGYCDVMNSNSKVKFTSSQVNNTFRHISDSVRVDTLIIYDIVEDTVDMTVDTLGSEMVIFDNVNPIDTITNPYLDDDEVEFINVLLYEQQTDILYMGSSVGVWRLNNASTADPEAWQKISTASVSPTTALAISEANPTTLYVGKRRFASTSTAIRMYKIEGADTVAENTVAFNMDLGANLPISSNIRTSSIATNPNDENHLIVTYSNYGVNNIFETKNATADTVIWQSLEGDLPNIPVNWALIHPDNSNVCYIATDFGVMYTDMIDGANTVWNVSSTMPLSRVDQLRIRESDNTILAATHGRGLWTGTINSADNDITWTERGPRNIGGRTRKIMIDPNQTGDNIKLWAASVGGGLWTIDDISTAKIDSPNVNVPVIEIEEIETDIKVYPNPIQENTLIEISSEKAQWLTLDVWNAEGKRVDFISAADFPKGKVTLSYSGRKLSPGTYYIRVSSGDRLIKTIGIIKA